MVKEDLANSWCGRLDDGDRRAQCLRDIESCTWPLGASTTCAGVLRRLSRDALCGAEDLKRDKVACLERQVDALTRELADLRRDLPRLIEQGVQRAMEPRLHR
jgi:hypothetical protein